MNDIRHIPVEDLQRRNDARPQDEAAIAALADSIGKLGLMAPLIVRALPGDRFEIIAGSHRFAACDSLDMREIPCRVVGLDDLHAELSMIDENLCRAELSPADRARQTARRKAIYEELHPQTKHGGNAGSPSGQFVQTDGRGFAEATADATRRDPRSVRRDAERGAKVIDEVLDMVRSTKLDTGAYLDKIKNLPPNEQVQAARRDLTIARTQAAPVKQVSKPKPEPGEAFTRFIRLVGEIEGIGVRDILAAAGSHRSTLGQRASGLADMLEDIMRGCD
jgi:hypothetical protein